MIPQAAITTFLALLTATQSHAQTFALTTESDSLSVLLLYTDHGQSQWKLPHPVYQFQTGDVDGDGSIDAMVGVIKTTRFRKEKGRRLFVFKNHKGHIRPLWMGSKLGGILHDFRFIDGRIRSLETSATGQWYVADYQWRSFGMSFVRFLARDTDYASALKTFNDPNL